jgi:PadR family transcriptional regulator PadR
MHGIVMTETPDTEAIDKWEIQLRKGSLGLAVLASLWNGKLYGLEILRTLETGSDLLVGEGTIYPLLNRLKAEGLVRSEWVEAEAGHPRKYYWLTDEGRDRARHMAGVWGKFSGSLNQLLGPLKAGGE